MEPFRCILASRLLLDHQLHGTRALPPQIRRTVEDAALTTFERIVDECLAHNVHALLLSGNCVDPDDRGLRGPAALVRGIERLAEHDIAVIVDAGPDAWANWPSGLRFPPNVHRLGIDKASVAVSRSGHLLATVAAEGDLRSAGVARSGDRPQQAGDRAWRIHLPDATITSGIVHELDCPAAAQGISPAETGPRGCLLAEIEPYRGVRQTFVSAAVVRWERFEMAVAAETSRDDLVQEMASVLERSTQHACEKVWLVGWDVRGEGRLCESLSDELFRNELLADLAALDPVPDVQIHTYDLKVHSATARHDSIVSKSAAGSACELEYDYATRLHARFAHPEPALRELLAKSGLHGGPWEARLGSLITDIDCNQVSLDAQKLGAHLFTEGHVAKELSS